MQPPLSTSTSPPSTRLVLLAQRHVSNVEHPLGCLSSSSQFSGRLKCVVCLQVAITDALINRGMLLLRPEHVVMLGGEVMLPSAVLECEGFPFLISTASPACRWRGWRQRGGGPSSAGTSLQVCGHQATTRCPSHPGMQAALPVECWQNKKLAGRIKTKCMCVRSQHRDQGGPRRPTNTRHLRGGGGCCVARGRRA